MSQEISRVCYWHLIGRVVRGAPALGRVKVILGLIRISVKDEKSCTLLRKIGSYGV